MTTYIGNPPKSVYGVRDATNIIAQDTTDGTSATLALPITSAYYGKAIRFKIESPIGLAIGTIALLNDVQASYTTSFSGNYFKMRHGTDVKGFSTVPWIGDMRSKSGCVVNGDITIDDDGTSMITSAISTVYVNGTERSEKVHWRNTWQVAGASGMTELRFVHNATTGGAGSVFPAGVTITVLSEEATNLVLPLEYSAPRQNILINSDFAVNQRAYAGGALSASVFGYDRWGGGLVNTTMSVSGHVATIDNTTASTNGQVYQGIEAGQMIEGRQYTVSWKGDAEVAVYYANGGSYVWHSEPFTFIAGTGISTVDEYISFRGDGATISELKLEEGTSATPWEKPDKPQELARCQHYCYRLTGADYSSQVFAMGFHRSTTDWWGSITLPVEMRARPTMTLGGVVRLLAASGGHTVNQANMISVSDPGRKVCTLRYTTTTSWGANIPSTLTANNDATAYIQFDAEI